MRMDVDYKWHYIGVKFRDIAHGNFNGPRIIPKADDLTKDRST